MAKQESTTGWRLAKESPALMIAARLALLAVVIVVIVLVTTNHHKTVQHPYALTPPAGWSRVSKLPAGASVAFVDPTTETGVTGKVQPIISVQFESLDVSELKMNFGKLSKLYLSGIAANYLEYHQLQLVQKTVAARPAILVTYSFSQDNEPLTAQTLFLTKYGNSYAATGQSLTSTWPSHAADIQKSLLTFKT